MMNFVINESDIPVLPQRRALMVIDLQKGLIDSDGVCPTGNPAKLIENVEALVPEFRKTGSIIWVTTQYEKYRPVNGKSPKCEWIITNKEMSAAASSTYRAREGRGVPGNNVGNRHLESKSLPPQAPDEADDSFDAADPYTDADEPFGGAEVEAEDVVVDTGDTDEKFLSVGAETKVAQSLKDDPALLDALQHLSKPNDIYFAKSHYSAFKSGSLLLTLRRNLITELFICGALSNTSVYATAVEAASYGMVITLVDDCLGWRGKTRHELALRELTDEYGCDKLTSEDIIANIQEKRAKTTAKRPVRHQEKEELSTMLGMLKLQSKATTRPSPDANDIQGEIKASSPGSPMAITNFGEDDESWAAIRRPMHHAEVAGKARVKSKITQRRDIGKELETLVKVERKTSKKNLLNSPSSLEEAAKEGPPKDPNLIKPALWSKDRSDTTTGKNDPPSSMSVKNNTTKRDNGRQANTSTPSTNKNISPTSATESPSMTCSAEGEPICEGDTVVISNLLPRQDAGDSFERLKGEIRWQRMSHQGGEVPRLVAVQGEIGKDGDMPVYRHPADESPPLLAFSPTVSLIRRHVEKATGHAVNHSLIQYYRDGKDYISEHSDKTLDIVPGTYIANVSLGAERTMVFRGKRDSKDSDSTSGAIAPRKTARANLPHNSMMRMGPVTNMRWMHSIRQDKRREQEKTAPELDFGGCRISLTFRLIGTFLSKDQSKIWGQGAVAKDKSHARSVVNRTKEEATRMIQAFGLENRSSRFDWQEVYGHGFDVLHMSDNRRLLVSGNKHIDYGVQAILEHLSLEWSPSSVSAPVDAECGIEEPVIKLVDTDISKSTVQGHAAVLLYLDAVHFKRESTRTPFEYAKLYTRLHLATALSSTNLEPTMLNLWETFAAEDVYIAGPDISIVDFAFFPFLRSFEKCLEKGGLPRLKVYCQRMEKMDAFKKVLDSSSSE